MKRSVYIDRAGLGRHVNPVRMALEIGEHSAELEGRALVLLTATLTCLHCITTMAPPTLLPLSPHSARSFSHTKILSEGDTYRGDV